jgi:hypothetical protein
MEAKLKAKELIENFLNNIEDRTGTFLLSNYSAKQCALIAVNEIFEHIDYIFQELKKDKLPNKFDDEIEYWNEVKKEIEKL